MKADEIAAHCSHATGHPAPTNEGGCVGACVCLQCTALALEAARIEERVRIRAYLRTLNHNPMNYQTLSTSEMQLLRQVAGQIAAPRQGTESGDGGRARE